MYFLGLILCELYGDSCMATFDSKNVAVVYYFLDSNWRLGIFYSLVKRDKGLLFGSKVSTQCENTYFAKVT